MFRVSAASRLTVLLALLLLLGAGGSAQPISARHPDAPAAMDSPPLLYLAPTLSLIPIGGTACVDLRVEDVDNLFGFETILQFDPTRASIVDAVPGTPGVQVEVGPFLQPANPSNWFVINTANNTNGTVRVAITRMAPESGASGSGVLARICLRGINRGHTPLTLSPSATIMLDPYVSFLPFDLKSGGAFVGPVLRYRIPITVRGF